MIIFMTLVEGCKCLDFSRCLYIVYGVRKENKEGSNGFYCVKCSFLEILSNILSP